MRTSLRRWIIGCTVGFGTMAFVAAAAMLSPPEPSGAARIASDCTPRMERIVTHSADDA